MASGLSWFPVDVNLRAHPKALELAALLGDPRAHTWLPDLWAWAYRCQPTGTISGKHPGRVIEMAVGWTGAPDALWRAMVDARWLDRLDDGSLHIHGWEEHAGPLLAKNARDAERQKERRAKLAGRFSGGKNRPSDVRATSDESHTDVAGNRNPNPNRNRNPNRNPNSHSSNDDPPPPPAADPHGFFARFQAARGAQLGAVSERLKKNKKRDEPGEWRALYQQRLEQLAGDEAALWRVFEAYLEDRWGLSRDPPCTWHGLKSDEVFDRCASARLESQPTGPPPPKQPDTPAGAKFTAVLEQIRRDGKTYALQWLTQLRAVSLGAELLLEAKDRYQADWVGDHYAAALTAAAGIPVRVVAPEGATDAA